MMKDLCKQLCARIDAEMLSSRLIDSLCRVGDDELRECLARATPHQQQIIAVRAVDCIRHLKAQSMLIIGMMIHVFILATPDMARGDQIEEMYEETGVSRSQQYRCRNAFLRFGRTLLTNPRLAALFVAEAIKLLSEPKVPEAASYEAIKRAHNGEIITIKVAESIIKAHSPSTKFNPERIEASGRSDVSDVSVGTANDVKSGPAAPTRTCSGRGQIDAEAMKGIAKRHAQLERQKMLKADGMGKCVHHDNAVQVFIRSVKQEGDPTPEEILYGLQQAYERLRMKHPVLAIVAGGLETSHLGA
ncbi:hypothetical protein RISK_005267 [Rhodopirellula islandica]|uniref:Uncharacterized protein n=1 Tax=Rhodopirellula islandica TaxID=595434 RepID=A0A0J1B6U4_RHOIS|nr:hypothetical protein [Rhodopirellula islandica]KLU02201.1 hypothetical protein RISK_005267 [Rhodopirellula islandica]